MKNTFRLTIVCAFLLMAMPFGQVQAQHELPSNELMYHSFRLPQSNQLNPSFFPRNNLGYFTLPRVNVSFGMPIHYKDLGLQYNPTTRKTELNIVELLNKLSEDDQLNFDVNFDIFGFGFRVNRMFFTFGSSVSVNANVTLPKDAFETLTGNGDNLVGSENAMDLASDDFVTLNSYLRLSLGGGYEFEQIPLTIGAHINFLNGIANVNTKETDIKLYATDRYYSSLIALMDYKIQSAGIASFKNQKIETSGSPSNWGCTFDLGAQYAYDNFLFSASLIDVGPGIHWSQNVMSHTPKKNTITFSGVDITTLITGGQFDTTFAQRFRDSLTYIYEMNDEEGGDFWFSIPTKINLGASYTFWENRLRAGFLFHGQWDKGLVSHGNKNNRFRFNTTLSLTANFGDWFEIMVGNSLVFDSHRTDLINPGIGFIVTPFKTIQFYTMLDYISDFYVVECKSFNFSAGLNLMVFNAPRQKEVSDIPTIFLPEAYEVEEVVMEEEMEEDLELAEE